MTDADIRTVETLEVDGDYRVNIAQAGDGFEAAVVESRDRNPLTRAVGSALSDGYDGWSSVDDAPRVRDAQKYVTMGMAVDEYLDQFAEDDEDDEVDEDGELEPTSIDFGSSGGGDA